MTSSIDHLNRNSSTSFASLESIPSQGKFHKISDAGKYIVHSINKVAQLILSACISVVSLGKYNLDDLKKSLFPNQTSVIADSPIKPSRVSLPPPDSAPPPPPPPPLPPLTIPVFEDANRSSRSNSIHAKPDTQEALPKEGICTLEYNNVDSISKMGNLPLLEEATACPLDNNNGLRKEKSKKFTENVGNIAQEALAAFNKRRNKNKI